MPELPEVETVRRQLETALCGETIVEIELTGHRTVRRQPREEFVVRAQGRTVMGVRRWGKFLLVDLDLGEVLVMHLRMSGQLSLEEGPEAIRLPHTHLVFRLSSGRELRFVDPRTFGECFISDVRDERGLPVELAHLGIDPIRETLTEAHLSTLCRNRRIAIKTLLLDQRHIAGIGNIYGDEICFRAGVRPTRRAESLTKKECARIAASTREVLEEAIAHGGSTLSDRQYRDLEGGHGSYQERHDVYGRAGNACHHCGTTIKRVVVGGRSAHFCPSCQR